MQLHLHVGHGKTGSSFLQSWWALNRSELWQLARLLYPVGGADQHARLGAFSMGNGLLLDQALEVGDQPAELRRLWAEVLCQVPGGEAPRGVLFSAERWARHLPGQLDALLRVADAGGVEMIRIWLLVRDPLDHALSVYGQMVKRHGFSGSLDDWLQIYEFPRALLNCLDVLQTRSDRIVLQVDHYGRQRRSLHQRMLDWLALPGDSIWQQPPAKVNRSLSADELLLMRWLNERLGDRAAAVGEQLVDRLPELTPARLHPSADRCARFVQSWSATVDQINQRLPEGAQLCWPEAVVGSLDRQSQQPLICLLPEQLDCLFDGLMQVVAR
jgi:hypothetical protein